MRILANEEQNTVQLNLMEMLISKSVLRNGWSNLTSFTKNVFKMIYNMNLTIEN